MIITRRRAVVACRVGVFLWTKQACCGEMNGQWAPAMTKSRQKASDRKTLRWTTRLDSTSLDQFWWLWLGTIQLWMKWFSIVLIRVSRRWNNNGSGRDQRTTADRSTIACKIKPSGFNESYLMFIMWVDWTRIESYLLNLCLCSNSNSIVRRTIIDRISSIQQKCAMGNSIKLHLAPIKPTCTSQSLTSVQQKPTLFVIQSNTHMLLCLVFQTSALLLALAIAHTAARHTPFH